MSRYRCPECAYQYDESQGDRHEGLKPGTPWLSLPEDFACPGCSVRVRDDFEVLAPTAPESAQ
jgi:rubredoxin